ncbi:MAG: hypothetical protein ABH830_02410, partial [Patescibacteria group bacterium]
MIKFYLLIFLFSLILSVIFTFIVKKLAVKIKIVDQPGLDRKIHGKAVPLMGGVAIFFSFFIVLYFVCDKILAGNLELHHWLGVFFGALILIIGGYLDDKYNLAPKWQIIFPILASLSVIIGGVGIEKITNPFGGFLYLDSFKVPFFAWGGSLHNFIIIADLFTF